MTAEVLGYAYIDVVARTGKVEGQVKDGLKSAEGAAKASGERMGRQVADGVEKGTARVARSGRILAGVFTSNSAQALGPLQEVADRVGLIGATMDQTRTKAGGMLLGVGAAVTGVGAFVSTLASREQGAMNQLSAAITAQGGSIGIYRDEIDKAVKSGEKFGQSGNQTIDAVKDLTIGLHDPKKALDELGLAEDVAAAKHISLSSAANLVRQAYNGNTRVLKAFGIQVSGIVDGQKLLADAHGKVTKANTDAADAQKAYTDKLAIYNSETKHTLASEIGLKNAHDKLLKAQLDQAVAAKTMSDAQQKANASGAKGQQVLDQLAKITAGQAAAGADTFTGHLKAMGAALEDDAAKFGGPVGHALIEFGPAMAGVGAIIESGLLPRIGRGITGFLHLRDTEVLAAADGSAATELGAAKDVLALQGVEAKGILAANGVRDAQVVGAAEGAAAVDAAAASEVAALERVGVAGAATGGILSKVAGAAFGLPGLVATAGTAGIYKFNKWAHSNDTAGFGYWAQDNPLSNWLFGGPPPKSSDAVGPSANQTDLPNKSKLHLGMPSTTSKSQNKPVNPLDSAVAAAEAQLKHDMAMTPDQWAKSIGIETAAGSAAISAAQKTAADNARALGAEVTAGMRAQVATVKHEIAGLNAEIKKMTDLRGQVVASAATFTGIAGLLPDNTLASAGSLVAAEQAKVAAEKLFGKNLKSLGARGLDKGVIAELAKEGPAQRALASALAAGTNVQLKQFNAAEVAARQQGQVLGSTAVDAAFGSGAAERTQKKLASMDARLALLNKQLAGLPAAQAKAADQARRNAAVTKTQNSRTAVPR